MREVSYKKFGETTDKESIRFDQNTSRSDVAIELRFQRPTSLRSHQRFDDVDGAAAGANDVFYPRQNRSELP